jgi:hypothetical protein
VDLLELRLLDGRDEEAVLDRAVGHHHDGEHLPGVRADEAQVLQRERLGSRRDDERGRAGELGEQPARVAEEVRARLDLGEAMEDLRVLFVGELPHFHHRVDEEAERLVGGDAPRARVRLVEVAELFEIGEHVPDARGREADALLRERARADGLAARDELGDAGVEDLPGARVQLGHRREILPRTARLFSRSVAVC